MKLVGRVVILAALCVAFVWSGNEAEAQVNGQRVLGRAKGKWRPGVVSKVTSRRVYVRYDYGRTLWYPRGTRYIRSYDWRRGTRLRCQVDGERTWRSGRIMWVRGRRVGVQFKRLRRTLTTGACRDRRRLDRIPPLGNARPTGRSPSTRQPPSTPRRPTAPTNRRPSRPAPSGGGLCPTKTPRAIGDRCRCASGTVRQLSRDKKAFRCIQPGSLVCTPNQSFKTALACRCPAGTRKQTSRDRRTFACVTPAPRAPAAPRNISALERNLHAKRFKATRRQFSNNSQRMVTIKHDLSFVATMGGCRLGFDHFRITSLKTVFGGSGFISMNQRGCVEIRGDVMRFIVHQKCTGRTNSSRLCRMQRVRPFVFAQTRFKVFRDGIRVNFAGQVLNFAFVKVLGRR